MKKRNGKTIKILKGEKILYAVLVFLIIALPISSVFTKAILSETNITKEQLKNKINKQSNKNDSLSMQVNELASLDKIEELAKDNGLSYNNDNIKIINKN